MPKIKIEKSLYEKVKQYSEKSGYSSPDEFVNHMLEEVVGSDQPDDLDEDVMKRLKGLGYIS
jgi:hypothetical protein